MLCQFIRRVKFLGFLPKRFRHENGILLADLEAEVLALVCAGHERAGVRCTVLKRQVLLLQVHSEDGVYGRARLPIYARDIVALLCNAGRKVGYVFREIRHYSQRWPASTTNRVMVRFVSQVMRDALRMLFPSTISVEGQQGRAFVNLLVADNAVVFRLAERLAALGATVAQASIGVLSMVLRLYPAVVAGHGANLLESRGQKPDNGIGRSVRLRSCGFWPRRGLQSKPGLLLHGYGGGGIGRSPPSDWN